MNAHAWQAAALMATITVECAGMAAAALFLRRDILLAVYWCALVNVVVHSLFWAALPWVADWTLPGSSAGLWLAEGVVALLEGAVYWRVLKFEVPVALCLALLLNLASWWLGSHIVWLLV